MYKFKQMAKRGSAFVGALTLLAGIGSSAMPALASADALNPLTDRSLTLSSSSPGWSFRDGSGNDTYSPPNSGANGKQSGNTFSFKTSTLTKTIKAFTFQYCTTPAGNCVAPGNDGYGAGPTRNGDVEGSSTVTGTSDLNVATSSPAEISDVNWTAIQARHSTFGSTLYANTPNKNDSEGNFIVTVNGATSQGWTMTASNLETGTVGASTATGKNNLITLVNTTGQVMTTNDLVKVIFFGTTGNYITNPGDGAFFVKINNYDVDNTIPADLNPTTSTHIIDGGVTVANVMNESISIQTKVLETMAFSVGVKDPDTFSNATLATAGIGNHGQCSSILTADPTGVANSTAYNALPHNVLKLGDSAEDYSLETGAAHTVQSYWRLSSNSSGGATVYYTGHTLTNTEGDQITPMTNTGTQSNPGTEQFGLGIAQDNTGGKYAVAGDTYGSVGTAGDFADYVDQGPTFTAGNPDLAWAHLPQLLPLSPFGAYGDAAAATPKYAFSSDADTYAQELATESTQVVNCVTAKMQYIANIAATTPAGVYTTKINYVAAPQY